MNQSPLQSALDWWEARDDMGGFRAAAAELFPGWQPKRACRAPHREDRAPSFSLYRGQNGRWRFKDHATGEQGGLVGFVMLAGGDGRDAARWLMEKSDTGYRILDSGYPDPLATHSVRTNHPASSIQHPVSAPYRLSETELRRCRQMSEALAMDAAAIGRIASARGWNPETIRGLALDQCLGLHEGRLVMIYPTGAKKRFKPLSREEAKGFQGTKFAWLFGKPDSLWRGDRLVACTERVHITEGETDAIALIDAGFDDGTTRIVMAVPGASCWRDEWAAAFRGLHIQLWPDRDAAGERLTQRIFDSLSPVAARIQLPGN